MNSIIHCHSKYSHDSTCRPNSILNFCVKNNISIIILSDHDNVSGSIELANLVKFRGLNIIVPPAAEYKTEYGDVILVGLSYTLEDKTFDNLIKVAKKNNCKLLLPHPFHDHTNIEYLARNVDYIEIVNARCSELENQKAQELSNLLSKKSYASPDAHLLKEYNNCIIKFDATTDKDWREILDSNWSFHSNISAKQYNVYFSSLIKSVKLKSPEVFVKSLIRLLTFGYKFKRN